MEKFGEENPQDLNICTIYNRNTFGGMNLVLIINVGKNICQILHKFAPPDGNREIYKHTT